MPKFTKAQYEHFQDRFRYLVRKKVEALGEPEELSNEDKVAQVMNGMAQLKTAKLFPTENGRCDRWLDEFLEFFYYKGDEERQARNLKLNEDKAKLTTKLENAFKDLLDQYVVGVITGDEFIADLDKIMADN